MLKRRLIGFLPIKNGIVVQSIGFCHYRPIGKPRVAAEFLNSWGIDEIAIVDIDATRQGGRVDLAIVRDVAKVCFVPLTVGGGVRSVSDMREIIHSGADKILINTAALDTPTLIKQAAETFGSQCVIVSIDVKTSVEGLPEVFRHSRGQAAGISPVDLAQRSERLGAGEIFLNSIDRDGSKKGYDLDLAESVANAVGIPVIVCGGAGLPRHFAEGLRLPNVSGVAAGNFFHFEEHSVTIVKSYLRHYSGLELRSDTYADYSEFSFDENGRLAKKSDEELARLLFEFHPKEAI